MGGHGGLNILPQKSWHVYRLDNRLKVDKDKQKHQELQEAERTGVNAVRLQRNISTLRKRNRALLGSDIENSSTTSKPTRPKQPKPNAADAATALKTTLGDDEEKWGSGRRIHLFEDEERQHEELRKQHTQRVKELSLGDGKTKLEQSDFTVDAKRKPWYTLNPSAYYEVETRRTNRKSQRFSMGKDADSCQNGGSKIPATVPSNAIADREVLRQRRLDREKRER